jgi:hypothetical protein
VKYVNTKTGKRIKVWGNSPCQKLVKCQCGKVIDRSKVNKEHVCGERYCGVCKRKPEHLCYMQSVDGEGGEDAMMLVEEEELSLNFKWEIKGGK